MWLRCHAIIVFLSALPLFAVAARVEQQAKLLQALSGAPIDHLKHAHANTPNTYYFDVSKPVMALSPRGSGRAGRTALTVTVSEASVSKYMPVVSPTATGMVHIVSNTWSLKGLGTMFMHANGIEGNPAGPRLFPCTILAVEAADDNAAVKPDVSSIIQAAEKGHRRNLWTETTPSSALLLPVGQSTGAVADLLDVSYDAKADTVTIELDLVHSPHIMSEFEPHGKQTLEVDQAHYHFLTGPGVMVDAQALVKSLQDTQFAVEGMHVFFKNGATQTCFGVTLDSTTTNFADVGTVVNVTVTLDGADCNCDNLGNCPNKADTASIPAEYINGYRVRLLLVGPGQWDDGSTCSDCINIAADNPSLKRGPGSRRAEEDAGIFAETENGVAWATFNVTAEGPISVVALGVHGNYSAYVPNVPGAYLFFNGEGQCSGTVAKLLLHPQKAYRHVHDSIVLTVQALDASGAPVSGASVALAVHGDCEPNQMTVTITTGDDGTTSFLLTAKVPGFASVVAAALGADSTPVTSPPAHIIFFEERHYIDHREAHYYSDSGDAERFAAAAAKAAVQQASSKHVSKTN